MSFIDREGQSVDIDFEIDEQMLVRTYVPPDSCVLEMGARYGTVSCVISEVLTDPRMHVAVEPDPTVIDALEKNKAMNGGGFHIYNGVVSKEGYQLNRTDPKVEYHEYGTYTKKSETPNVKNMSYEELEKYYGLSFDCIVADCEGFFYDFVKENLDSLKKMRVLIYEQDGTPWSEMIEKYKEVDDILENQGFKLVHTIPHPEYANNPRLHNVWVRTSEP